MKRFLVMILFILLLTGCGKTPDSQEKTNIKEANMFVCIQSTDFYDVVYHRDTKVMYAISRGAYNYGNFTLLVNPDGSPMLYETESEVNTDE